jgi:uncharacterized protein (TIGR03435 family)
MMSVTKALLTGALLIFTCYAQSGARLEFEAASVKPASPPFDHAFCRGGPGSTDPELFHCENMGLANLVILAYELGPNRLSAPDWMGSAGSNIYAKVPRGTTREQFRMMLQNLLADRFKLATHHETRESSEFRLVVAKGGPKFKPAASKPESSADAPQEQPVPEQLPFDREGYPTFAPGESGTTSTPAGRTRMQDPRMRMSTLAAMLSGSLHTTVVDATGLDGEYEISLYWILDSAPAAAAADDAAGPMLVQALQKELGLRLEKTANGTKDVLVVDHAEKVPNGN